jgi:hypothetical protein
LDVKAPSGADEIEILANPADYFQLYDMMQDQLIDLEHA